MALKFKVGDRVVDQATGKSGLIRSAEPRAGGGPGLFTVVLFGGVVVLRGGAELEAERPVAPAPGEVGA